MPPLYNWLIDKKTFYRLFTDEWYAVRDHETDEIIAGPRYSKQRLREAFKKYMMRAQQNHDFMYNRGAGWVLRMARWLRALPQCRSFLFGLVDYAEFDSELSPPWPRCVQRDVSHGRLQLRARTRDVADVAFGLALEAMIISGAKVHGIENDNPGCGGELWQCHLRDKRLDLGELTGVCLRPSPAYRDIGTGDAIINARVSEDMAYLISKCASTMEVISCTGFDVLEWKYKDELSCPMSKLRVVSLGPCTLQSACLTTWISSSAKLEIVHFDGVGLPDGEDLYNWKTVFDAVRNHQNSLQIRWRLYVWDDYANCATSPHVDQAWKETMSTPSLLKMKMATRPSHESSRTILIAWLTGVAFWNGSFVLESQIGKGLVCYHTCVATEVELDQDLRIHEDSCGL